MRRHDLISSALLFFVGLFTVVIAPQYDLGTASTPGAGLMPFLSGSLMCFFAVLTFLKAYRHKSGEVKKIWADIQFKKLIFVLIILFLYALFLEKVGFLISTFLLIFLLLRSVDPRPWLMSLLGGGLTSILSYLIFETWLKAQLPRGIFGF
jgi:putative tricarboxylic transport membrane protein